MGDEYPAGFRRFQVTFHIFRIGHDDRRDFTTVFLRRIHGAVLHNDLRMQLQHAPAMAARALQRPPRRGYTSVSGQSCPYLGAEGFDGLPDLFRRFLPCCARMALPTTRCPMPDGQVPGVNNRHQMLRFQLPGCQTHGIAGA